MAKTPNTPEGENPSKPSGAESPAALPFGAATYGDLAIAVAKATIAKNLGGRRTGWSQEVHAMAIARLAIAFGLPAEAGPRFLAALGHKGLGGNASQFRQWLEASGDKGPGLLDESSRASLVVDLT